MKGEEGSVISPAVASIYWIDAVTDVLVQQDAISPVSGRSFAVTKEKTRVCFFDSGGRKRVVRRGEEGKEEKGGRRRLKVFGCCSVSSWGYRGRR